MPKIIEKEIKFLVGDPLYLIKCLKSQNAVFAGYHQEKTIRLDQKGWELSNIGTFIRLRSGFKNTLTLKQWLPNSEVRERREVEIEVSDLNLCQEIFHAIGLTETLIMEKNRMMWSINDVSITIDELPFGVYSELEGPVPSIKIIAELLNLDFNKKILGTYWELYDDLMASKKVEGYDPNIVFPPDYESKFLMT